MVLFFDGFMLPDDLSTAFSAIIPETWFSDDYELEKGLVESSFSQKSEFGFISGGVTIGE
jgi:hypothetical protein